MKIKVNGKTVFRIGTVFAARTVAFFYRRSMRKEGIKIKRKQTRAIIKELKAYKKSHPDFMLVDVSKPSGESVNVIL